MSGRRSRTKGHNFEREVARLLTEATGDEYKRVLVETREGNSGDVACEDADTPVAIVRRHNGGNRTPDDVVVLRLVDFLSILAWYLPDPPARFRVQTKVGLRPSPFSALREAVEAVERLS